MFGNTLGWLISAAEVAVVAGLIWMISAAGKVSPPTPEFQPGSVTLADQGCNANDGFLVAGETAALTVPLENIGRGLVSGITGTLSSLTTGVTVVSALGVYPNIAFASSAASVAAYTIAVDPTYPCGQPATLRLDISASGFTSTWVTFELQTGVITSTSILLSENFDAVIAPALPAGWVLNNGCATPTLSGHQARANRHYFLTSSGRTSNPGKAWLFLTHMVI